MSWNKITELKDGPVQYEIDAFLPLLGEKYVLAFHDVYPWSYSEAVHEHLFNKIGKRVEIAVPHPAGENLGVVINL